MFYFLKYILNLLYQQGWDTIFSLNSELFINILYKVKEPVDDWSMWTSSQDQFAFTPYKKGFIFLYILFFKFINYY